MLDVGTEMKRYGVRGRLPQGDPMSASHLLGANWEWTRWFDSEEARDRFFEQMRGQFQYYRPGDIPSLVLEKIDEG